MHIFPLISLAPLLTSQVVYKLTDFGYAKSYDKSSVCTSLVGTVQYVVSVCACTSLVGTVQYVVSVCACTLQYVVNVHMVDIVLRLFRLLGSLVV